MASKFERINAASIFRLQKQGQEVPPEIRGAARRTFEGNSSPGDAETIRIYLGIKRTGDRQAKRQFRSANLAIAKVVETGRAIDYIQRGGSAAMTGVVNLVQLGTKEIESLVSNKRVKELFVGVATKMYGEPQKALALFYGMRRVVRAGGALLGAAAAGYEVGSLISDSLESARTKRSAALGQSFDLSRQFGFAPGRLRGEERRMRAEREGAQNMLEIMAEFYGLDSGLEDQIKERLSKRAKALRTARKNAEGMGIDRTRVLAEHAGKLGKSIDELSASEEAEALDDALKEKMDPRRLINDPRVDTQLALRRWLKWKTPDFRSEAVQHEERVKIAEELRAQDAERSEEMDKFRKREMEWHEKYVITPEDRMIRRQVGMTTEANWDAYRSRHRAWSND